MRRNSKKPTPPTHIPVFALQELTRVGSGIGSLRRTTEIKLNKFIEKCDAGELHPIDLDGDGSISYPEAYIQSFFAIKSNQDKPYNGLITFFDFDDILWE